MDVVTANWVSCVIVTCFFFFSMSRALSLAPISLDRTLASPPLWNICDRPAVSPDNRPSALYKRGTFAFVLCGSLFGGNTDSHFVCQVETGGGKLWDVGD